MKALRPSERGEL